MNPASLIDHTLLRPDASSEQIAILCEEAVEHGFAAVCVPPVYVPLAVARLYGSQVRVATVAGFPLGYQLPAEKAFAAAQAAAQGAEEIDMVIHLGAALAGRLDEVEEEIREVVRAADGTAIKVILECCYLPDALKKALVTRVVAAGAAYVKTSTGFGPGGATEADVRLLSAAADSRIGVKAAGGIRDWSFCQRLLSGGATRIGTSAGPRIVSQWRQAVGL
ncbi:MAG: deoxyribose-phosphate aldolase [Desulfuromonadales bacterium]